MNRTPLSDRQKENITGIPTEVIAPAKKEEPVSQQKSTGRPAQPMPGWKWNKEEGKWQPPATRGRKKGQKNTPKEPTAAATTTKPIGKNLCKQNDEIHEGLKRAGEDVVLEIGHELAHDGEPAAKVNKKKGFTFEFDKKILYYGGGAVALALVGYAVYKMVGIKVAHSPTVIAEKTIIPEPEVSTGPRMVKFNIAAEGMPPRYIEVPAEKVGQ